MNVLVPALLLLVLLVFLVFLVFALVLLLLLLFRSRSLPGPRSRTERRLN